MASIDKSIAKTSNVFRFEEQVENVYCQQTQQQSEKSLDINKKEIINEKCKNLNKLNVKYCGYPINSVLINHCVLFTLILLNNILSPTHGFKSDESISLTSHNNYHQHLQPSDHFSQYTLIEPNIYHGRHKNLLSDTIDDEDGLHTLHITIKYKLNATDVILDLQLNDNMIPEGHFLKYQLPNGDRVVKNLTKTEVELCHYQGIIRDNPNSRVALSTCNGGLRGVVFDGEETYYIENVMNEQKHQAKHFVYRHSDMTHNATCGYEGGISESHDPELFRQSEFNRISRFKRSSPDAIIRGPYNANKDSSYVELAIVIDNKMFKSMQQNYRAIHQHCKDIVNIINALYVPLNIFVALVGVIVWNEQNEVELSSEGDKTLQNFLHYRRTVLLKDHPNDNAQLLTKEIFDGGVVGKALKGPICTYEYSGGVSMDHSTILGVVATTVAHEMGHNFGMEHDTPECKCEDDRCIMSASSSSVAPRHWSSCSIDQLNLAFNHGMNYCLKNKPTKLFDSPVCGNGFVEPGEQCDCGLANFCNNTCCDPRTCMLRSNASCATGKCCDLSTCRPRNAGSMCREAEGECDLPEYCSGESEYCPADVFKRDTESCDSDKAFCFQGSCRSQTDQCKVLWGPSGTSSEQCYTKNIEGTRHGNCGFDRLKKSYVNCTKEDVYCGMLHCRHLNERLEFGMESVAVLSHSFMNYKGSIIPCRTAIVDLGLESIDPGLAPSGAKCGEGKMCVNQKCMAVESLRASGRGIECPENCYGNGICNSQGHCHCNKGFSPPLCYEPGYGGSTDSGPASDPNEGSGFTKIMLIFFLGVVPCCVIFAFFVRYCRQKYPNFIKKESIIVIPASKPPTQPPRSINASSPNSPDDMNSALLRPSNDETSNNNMFGKFRGFTLKPLPSPGTNHFGATNVAFVHPVTKITTDENDTSKVHPVRSAPPVPKPLSIAVQKNGINNNSIKSIAHNNGINNLKNGFNNVVSNSVAPALPPLNPGSTARPIISSPILEASTCDRKELQSPLKNSNGKMPTRAAPDVPTIDVTELPQVEVLINPVSKEKKTKESTLNRITSFLKKDEKTSEVNKSNNKINKISIDKSKLKNIEISSPIPIVDDSSDSEQLESQRTQIARAQSMRDTNMNSMKRTNITTFGSMRDGSKRPPSMVVNSRPTMPPPRPPAPPILTGLKINGMPGYQNPPPPKKVAFNEYDDCEASEAPLARISEDNSPNSPDNIYSVIDESPAPTPNQLLSPPHTSTSGSTESMGGLLSEIVNEIQHRNFDSIYIASTLKKKKKKADKSDDEPSYVNTSEFDETSSEDEYADSKMKSNASTTSSGYLRPSAINTVTPIARVAPSKPETNHVNLSSFKNYKNDKDSKPPDISAITFKGPVTSKKYDEVPKEVTQPKPAPVSYKPYHSTVNRTGSSYSSFKGSSAGKKDNNIDISDNKKKSLTNGISVVAPNLKNSTVAVKTNGTSTASVAITTTPTTKTASGKIGKNNTESAAVKPVIAAIHKPKPSAKPTISNKSKIDSDKIKTKPSDIKSSDVNGKIPLNSSNSNGSTNSNSKFLNAAARPLPGKVSNVASLQQKFENKS